MPKLTRRTPCDQCPWRRSALPSVLGGNPPEVYADAVANNAIPSCHRNDKGWQHKDSTFCVGAIGTMNNMCMEPRWPDGMNWSVADKIGKRGDCFNHVAEFYRHHTGKTYVHPIIRARDADRP